MCLFSFSFCSQECVFENVRLNYSGEQGSTIRQLISTNAVRRSGLCCLSIPCGTKQHLIVAQEKGKICIIQLACLLKQLETGKHKLVLTKLNSTAVPCCIISLTPNQAREDLLVICGLKECHVLQLSYIGSVKKHIVITPQLEGGNYVKRAIWLPSSLNRLAIVTPESIQIYDLNISTTNAEYYFLLPTGKIRDCTFYFRSSIYTMYIMSSTGYIYSQNLSEECLANNGNYYITQILEVIHPLLKDINNQIAGGGVSIYFSHMLQLLFFSFGSGKCFAVSLENENTVKFITNIVTNSSSRIFSKASSQPLYMWSEATCHPGLVFAMFQNSNNVVVLMITPNEFVVQELKIQNSKLKIIDFIPIRQNIGCQHKTSLIILCEDGSLKLFNIDQSKTDYWLTTSMRSGCIAWKNSRSKRIKRYIFSKNLFFYNYLKIQNGVVRTAGFSFEGDTNFQ